MNDYNYKIVKSKEIHDKYNLSYSFIHNLIYDTTGKYVSRATLQRVLTKSIYHADYESIVCPLYDSLVKYDKDHSNYAAESEIEHLQNIVSNQDLIIEEKTKVIAILQMQINKKDKYIDRLLKIIETKEE